MEAAIDVGELTRRAEAIASHRIKHGSRLSWEDHYQQAWLTMLESRHNFRPKKARGAPFEAYAWIAATRQVWRAEQRATKDEVRNLATRLLEEEVAVEPELQPDKKLEIVEWRARVMSAVCQVLADAEDEVLRLDVLRLIVGEREALEIAHERGQSRSTVYHDSHKVRQVLRYSPELRRLWKERPR